MPTYVIGDIQGCFATLQGLLARIAFDPSRDTLWLAGDIVNRGPASADVLRWAYDMRAHVRMVLGNHDLRLLGLAQGEGAPRADDTLDDCLKAADLKDALAWLRRRPVFATFGDIAVVHAGLHPSWSVADALALSQEVQTALADEGPSPLLHAWVHKKAPQWAPGLVGLPRLCSILRVMTTLRVCRPDGEVLWRFTDPPHAAPEGFVPWFKVQHRRSQDTVIACGHWAALGMYQGDRIRALDTGCVWGKELTAWRVDDDTFYSEPARDGVCAGD